MKIKTSKTKKEIPNKRKTKIVWKLFSLFQKGERFIEFNEN